MEKDAHHMFYSKGKFWSKLAIFEIDYFSSIFGQIRLFWIDHLKLFLGISRREMLPQIFNEF